MSLTTTNQISFDELEASRPRPINEEHCECFMRERYQVALQLVLIHGSGLSGAARDAFPIIDSKDFSLHALRFWSLDFLDWREALKPRDQRTFNAIRFLAR